MAKIKKLKGATMWWVCAESLSATGFGPSTRELAQLVANHAMESGKHKVDWIAVLEQVDEWLEKLLKLGIVKVDRAPDVFGRWAHRWRFTRAGAELDRMPDLLEEQK